MQNSGNIPFNKLYVLIFLNDRKQENLNFVVKHIPD